MIIYQIMIMELLTIIKEEEIRVLSLHQRNLISLVVDILAIIMKGPGKIMIEVEVRETRIKQEITIAQIREVEIYQDQEVGALINSKTTIVCQEKSQIAEKERDIHQPKLHLNKDLSLYSKIKMQINNSHYRISQTQQQVISS